MSRPRFAILFAEEDDQHRAAAVAALNAFALTLTPLRAGGALDPGAPALLIWTAHVMRRDDLARAMLADVADVVLWRPGGTPAPCWLVNAYPVGPEMPVNAVAVMARLAVSESERRARIAAPQPKPKPKRLAMGLAVCGGVALVVAGAAMLIAMRAETPAPVAGLHGLQ